MIKSKLAKKIFSLGVASLIFSNMLISCVSADEIASIQPTYAELYPYSVLVNGQTYYSDFDLSGYEISFVGYAVGNTSGFVNEREAFPDYQHIVGTSVIGTATGHGKSISQPFIHVITTFEIRPCATHGHTDQILVTKYSREYDTRYVPCPESD